MGRALTLAHLIGRAPLGEVRMGFCTREHLHIFGGLNRSLPGGWEGISRGGLSLSLSQNTGNPHPHLVRAVRVLAGRLGSLIEELTAGRGAERDPWHGCGHSGPGTR